MQDFLFMQLSNSIIWAGPVTHMGRRAYRVSVCKHEGKGPFGRTRCRWEYNIKLDLKQIRLECVDWIELAQDRSN